LPWWRQNNIIWVWLMMAAARVGSCAKTITPISLPAKCSNGLVARRHGGGGVFRFFVVMTHRCGPWSRGACRPAGGARGARLLHLWPRRDAARLFWPIHPANVPASWEKGSSKYGFALAVRPCWAPCLRGRTETSHPWNSHQSTTPGAPVLPGATKCSRGLDWTFFHQVFSVLAGTWGLVRCGHRRNDWKGRLVIAVVWSLSCRMILKHRFTSSRG